MTEQPPVHPPEHHDPHHNPAAMPRWVPVAIGVVLVTLAALAVITGLRYRDQTLVRMMRPRHTTPRTVAPAPPGEPEPGASLIFPGDSGSNVPAAHEPVQGAARAEVSGGPGGVTSVVRMWARRGMRIDARPADAVVYVNDVAIGQASQFDSETEEYDFAAPGSYTIRLVAPGFKDRQFVVTATDAAKNEVATIEAKLEKQ